MATSTTAPNVIYFDRFATVKRAQGGGGRIIEYGQPVRGAIVLPTQRAHEARGVGNVVTVKPTTKPKEVLPVKSNTRMRGRA